MLGLAIPYFIGLVLGMPLAFRYSRFRDKSLMHRLGIGLLASLGIAITISGSLELLDLFGLTTDRHNVTANDEGELTDSEEIEPVIPAVENEPQETWEQEQRFPDGKLKATRTVTRDAAGEIVPHGRASTYYPNGQLKWNGNYELGKQVGVWEEHYPDGTKEGEGSIFEDGNGEEKHWHENGTLKSEGKWRHGVKHGLWKTWYASGQLAGEFPYETGRLHGNVREWHPNGERKLEGEFSNGNPVAPLKRWNEQGDLIETSTNVLREF